MRWISSLVPPSVTPNFIPTQLAIDRPQRSCDGRTQKSLSAAPRRHTVDGSLDLHRHIGCAHGPVAPAGDPCPGAVEAAERVLERRPLGAEEGDGEIVQLRLVGRPERLDRRHRVELADQFRA